MIDTIISGPWKCFHCDYETSNYEDAAAHFGDRGDRDEEPICRTWAALNADDKLNEYQSIIRELNAERDENDLLRRVNEGLQYIVEGHKYEISQYFKGCTSVREAWNQFDSMEGRALAAEERALAAEERLNSTSPTERLNSTSQELEC